MNVDDPERETCGAEAAGLELAKSCGGNGALVSVWADLILSIWKWTEVLYGPCFSPRNGTSIMMDGSGLMIGCADTPPTGDMGDGRDLR